tara:strand:- start:32 stop:835 length:804 start_codon:yes stop_codon:yes gene_type:complete
VSAVIPEVVIQAALVAGMRHLRQEPERFGQLFRDFPKTKREAIVKWFSDPENRVRLTFGFPTQDAAFPVWALRVVGDAESQAFIGDHVGDNLLPRNPMPEWGTEPEFTNPEFLGAGRTFQTEEQYQREEIVGYATDDENELREIGDGGDPVAPRDTFVERSGAYYQSDMQIQTIADQPELVLILTHVVRAVLHHSRTFMERNGLINVVIGRREYAPISGYFPVVAFSQAVTLNFLYLFSEPSTGPSIESLTMVLESLNFPGDTPLAL